MRRILPKSLMGQTLLAAAAALLVAQAISATLLYRASEQQRLSNIAERIVNRLQTGEFRHSIAPARDKEAGADAVQRPARFRRGQDDSRPPRGRRLPRHLQFRRVEQLDKLPRDTKLDALRQPVRDRLAQAITGWGPDTKISLVRRTMGDDPVFIRNARTARIGRRNLMNAKREIIVASVRPENAEEWLEVRVLMPEENPRQLPAILLQTGVLFVILIGLLYLILRRITRPLAQLTQRVDAFSRNPDAAEMLEESGPQDTRQLIAAHNAMEARVAALLDEKDVMLGAIGHDLNTPLAALRVRIESVADDDQRARMADSIRDLSHTLDDILSLARIGRSGAQFERVDLAALTASVTEEFEDLGEAVTLEASERCVREIQVTWLKRALRNLISNALRYGGAARVSLLTAEGQVILGVDDDGPGIPQDKIAEMLEPFQRGEASRNRSTGGAGLGLTLARAIADQHGGELVLSNRKSDGKTTGLRAEIRLP